MRLNLIRLLVNFNDSLNVHKPMSAQQISDCANSIISEGWMYKLDDIALTLRKARMGEFGKIEFKIDESDIWRFIKEYDNIRLAAVRKAANEAVSSLYSVADHPLQDITTEILEKMKQREMKQREVKPYAPPVRNELEKNIISEWDKLKSGNGPIDLREYKNNLLAFSEYALTRREEILEESFKPAESIWSK